MENIIDRLFNLDLCDLKAFQHHDWLDTANNPTDINQI